MNILAIDSCSSVAGGAILVDDILRAEFVLNDDKTHSVKLLPQIENMLNSANLNYNDIDYYVCTVGPGSFTGQRIGVSTLKAIAHAVCKPCVSVSALEALAYNIPLFDGYICPVMDARREQTYTAVYKFENGNLKTVMNECAISLDNLLDKLKSYKKIAFVGDGVKPFRQKINEALNDKAYFPTSSLINLRASSVAECAIPYIIKGIVTDYKSLLPKYLRLSQAEREYNERMMKK